MFSSSLKIHFWTEKLLAALDKNCFPFRNKIYVVVAANIYVAAASYAKDPAGIAAQQGRPGVLIRQLHDGGQHLHRAGPQTGRRCCRYTQFMFMH
jgi:hypothetical protein